MISGAIFHYPTSLNHQKKKTNLKFQTRKMLITSTHIHTHFCRCLKNNCAYFYANVKKNILYCSRRFSLLKGMKKKFVISYKTQNLEWKFGFKNFPRFENLQWLLKQSYFRRLRGFGILIIIFFYTLPPLDLSFLYFLPFS